MMGKNLRLAIDHGCSLAPYAEQDKAGLVLWLNEPSVTRWMRAFPSPYTLDHADYWLKLVAEQERQAGFPVHFAIRNAQHQCVGGIGLKDCKVGAHAELGFWLAPPYWGKGLITQAIGVFTRYAHQSLHLKQLRALVIPENQGSIRVLEKNGFVCRGSPAHTIESSCGTCDALEFLLTFPS